MKFILITLLIVLIIYSLFKKSYDEPFNIKKRIAICLYGQTRSNICCSNEYTDNTVLESFNTYFLNDEFKANYEYDIFISSENLDIEKTIQYFGKNNIKNIYINNCKDILNDECNNETYLNEIKNKPENYAFYLNKYKNINNNNKQRYDHNIMQFYRIYMCLKLLENYKNITEYDYIILSRFDLLLKDNICKYLNILENNNKIQLLTHCGLFAIGRPNIMKYFLSIVTKYGEYDFKLKIRDFKDTCNSNYYDYEIQRWTYAPEVQWTEHLLQYCDDNELTFNDIINSIDIASIYRINGDIIII